jgi:hypothetical protein
MNLQRVISSDRTETQEESASLKTMSTPSAVDDPDLIRHSSFVKHWPVSLLHFPSTWADFPQIPNPL